jgi:DNA-binding NarL/FixJ family response regulator
MAKAAKKLRLLVADDHHLVRRGIRALLEAHKDFLVVGEAVDGNDAVEKTKALKPDLAILDITMPGLDGLDATRQIGAATPHTKILVLTMHESDQMVRRVIEAGARGYVLKSDLAGQLVKAVKAVAAGKLSLTPRVSEIVLQAFLKEADEAARRQGDKVEPSFREVEVIRLLARGKTNKEISSTLGITTRTVETHRSRIMLKLGLHSLVDIVHYATSHGIV